MPNYRASDCGVETGSNESDVVESSCGVYDKENADGKENGVLISFSVTNFFYIGHTIDSDDELHLPDADANTNAQYQNPLPTSGRTSFFCYI